MSETQVAVLPSALQKGDFVQLESDDLTYEVARVLTASVFFVTVPMTVRKFGKYHTQRYESWQNINNVKKAWRTAPTGGTAA